MYVTGLWNVSIIFGYCFCALVYIQYYIDFHTHSRSVASSDSLELGQEMREDSPNITTTQQQPLTARTLTLPVNEENRNGTGLKVVEGDSDERGGERISSSDQHEVSDILTPLGDVTLPRKHFNIRQSSTTSLHSMTSSIKREKPPPLLRSEPLYVLRINVAAITALPNIQSNDISLRASMGTVQLTELLAEDLKIRAAIERSRDGVNWEAIPVIKARVEIGKQVQRYYSQSDSNSPDIMIMLAVSGLEASLLLKNVAILKDFFDDEFESETPVPIQVLVEDTQLQLYEDLGDTSQTDSTMNVCVKAIEVHRGKKIEETNLFSSSLTDRLQNLDTMVESVDNVEHRNVEETLRFDTGQASGFRFDTGQASSLREMSPAAVSTDGSTISTGQSNADLLHTFRSFVRVFESHVRRHGGLKVQLNQPDHIAGLLQDLQVSLSEEENMECGKTEPPPTYTETLKHDVTTTHQVSDSRQIVSSSQPKVPPVTVPTADNHGNQQQQQQPRRRESIDSPTTKSRSQELRKLRQDSQELSRIHLENEDLISQLMQTKMLLAERSQDLDEVTSECKKAKDDLVTHKQVLENYQEHIERLLTENADLKSIANALQ